MNFFLFLSVTISYLLGDKKIKYLILFIDKFNKKF